jgi:hypothetical protein
MGYYYGYRYGYEQQEKGQTQDAVDDKARAANGV